MRLTDIFSRRYTRSYSLLVVAAHHHHITSLARKQTTCSTWAPIIQEQQSRCRYPRIPQNASVACQFDKQHPSGVQHHLRHHRSSTSPASSRTGSSTFPHRTPASPSPLSKQLSTSSSSSSGTHARWHSTGANGAGSELSGAASDSGLDLSQRHYVTAYGLTELRMFHCDRVRKIPLSGLDPSMLIGFLCKNEADRIDLRQRVTEVCPSFIT